MGKFSLAMELVCAVRASWPIQGLWILVVDDRVISEDGQEQWQETDRCLANGHDEGSCYNGDTADFRMGPVRMCEMSGSVRGQG